MEIRPATPGDADGMSRVLRHIIEVTGTERTSDPAHVIANYIRNPSGIRCSVALDDAQKVLGFQSLISAFSGNPCGVPEDRGVIGTHISPAAHRRGIGSALFLASEQAASRAGLDRIDACIAAGNTTALRYYDAMGFRTYRQEGGVIQKVFVVRPAGAR